MPTAVCFTREARWHRREFFETGLKRLGFTISRDLARRPGPDDLLICWNEMRWDWPFAARYRAAGAMVMVSENGWIGSAPDGGKLYALCLDHHNGAGLWRAEGPERWNALGIELKPWRTAGETVLVLCQRGFGPPGVAQPPGWDSAIAQRLAKMTKRPVRIRRHLGLKNPPLEPDFRNCWCAVTWGSGSAIKAIAAGIPVFHEFKDWIGARAAWPLLPWSDIETPYGGDRETMFQRLAWAQWTLDEIASGEPMARLIELHREHGRT